MTAALDDSFAGWAQKWMRLAHYTGPDVPDVDARIEAVLALWEAEIPGRWERPTDSRLGASAQRYQRNHAGGAPRPGSEHELEHQVLVPDPSVVSTTCFGWRLIDGFNAVPLARDLGGGRRGNVEADMLLLVAKRQLERLLLVEAKTASNNAWFAAIENLRQLRLFTRSEAAQRVLPRDAPDARRLPVAAVVLGPKGFFASSGARQRAVGPTRVLQAAVAERLEIELELATWDADDRAIEPLL